MATSSEIGAVTEVVPLAPNEMSFFKRLGGCQLLSETKSQGQRQSQSRPKPAPESQRWSNKASAKPQWNQQLVLYTS